MRAPGSRLPVPVFLERTLPYAGANSLCGKPASGLVSVQILQSSLFSFSIHGSCFRSLWSPADQTATGRESAVRFGLPIRRAPVCGGAGDSFLPPASTTVMVYRQGLRTLRTGPCLASVRRPATRRELDKAELRVIIVLLFMEYQPKTGQFRSMPEVWVRHTLYIRGECAASKKVCFFKKNKHVSVTKYIGTLY